MIKLCQNGVDRGEGRKRGEEEEKDERNERIFYRTFLPSQPGRNISRPREMNHSYRLPSNFPLCFLPLHSTLLSSLALRAKSLHINRENARALGIICKWSYHAHIARVAKVDRAAEPCYFIGYGMSMSNKCRPLPSNKNRSRSRVESIKQLLPKPWWPNRGFSTIFF